MKKLIIIISIFLSFNSHAEWTKVLPGNNASLFIDFNTLIEQDGYIYWWYLDSWSDGSEKTYAQGDCNLKGFRVDRRIKYSFPMAEGEGIERDINGAWEYYQPNSGFEVLLNFICQMSKLDSYEKSIRIESLNKRNEAIENVEKQYEKQLQDEEMSPEQKTQKSAYLKLVQEKIKSAWRYDDAKNDWNCDVLITQANNGAVEAVKILDCSTGKDENPGMSISKSQAFGNSIRRAIFRSSPLPLPLDNELFHRDLTIKFTAD